MGDDLDPARRSATRSIFESQGFMKAIGARLEEVVPGRAVASLVPSDAVLQHDGFVHAAVVAGVLDTACGSAAFTLMPPGAGVLTVEYKINLLAPAVGERIVGTGLVIRAGCADRIGRSSSPSRPWPSAA